MRIYVASSWRNEKQQGVVKSLKKCGHDVYDFRHPEPDNSGFHWGKIDPDWRKWSTKEFKKALSHPTAWKGFSLDWEAMLNAELCVLVMPCGRSAHLEAGYFVGAKKRLIILLEDGEPELMYNMADYLAHNMISVIAKIEMWEGCKS